MNSVIEEHRSEVEAACREFHVRRLELFGSAATGNYRPGESDLDFLVEFAYPLPPGEYADSYFGLLERLEQIFWTHVDLVVSKAIKNPYFRESVDRTKVPLYAA